jgi:hypothetical protein
MKIVTEPGAVATGSRHSTVSQVFLAASGEMKIVTEPGAVATGSRHSTVSQVFLAARLSIAS